MSERLNSAQWARRYVSRIRNAAKREYAGKYLAWLEHDCFGEPPECSGIGAMAAQAVRLNLTMPESSP